MTRKATASGSMRGKDHLAALPKGFKLQEYHVEAILGHGGFGITYLAWDMHLNQWVAIKEYLPNDLAVRKGASTVFPKSSVDEEGFKWGLERFLDEARTLARFKHTNIVRTYRFFEENGTAYMVMEYEKGRSLASILKSSKEPPEEEILSKMLLDLISGLREVHSAGFLHRDIKPGNIFIREDGATPVLLDFGAARYAMGQKSRNITSIMTPGYAPFEQYQSKGNQGPWTDIYALGAVMYRAVTGKVPPEATARSNALMRKMPDPMTPAVEAGWGRYSRRFLEAIDRALMVVETERPQNVDEWRSIILGIPYESDSARSTKVPSSSPTQKGGKSPRITSAPRRWKKALAALLFLALLGTGGWYGYTTYLSPAQQNPGDDKPLSGARPDRLKTLPIHKEHLLAGHDKLIFCVAFSHDGSLLASSSLDETIRLWDPDSGQAVRTFDTAKTGTNWMSSIAFSPDDKLLASASFDEKVTLWEVSSGEALRTMKEHRRGKGVNAVAFSPDGKLVASGSEDTTVQVWDIEKDVLLHTLRGHGKEVSCVAFSFGRPILASGSRDGSVRLWNVSDGTLQTVLQGHADKVNGIAFSPDGNLLASGSSDKTVKIWDLSTGKVLRTLKHESPVNAVQYTPDGKTLVTGSGDVRFWDVQKGTALHTLEVHKQDVYSVDLSPNGERLASAGFDRRILIWSTK